MSVLSPVMPNQLSVRESNVRRPKMPKPVSYSLTKSILRTLQILLPNNYLRLPSRKVELFRKKLICQNWMTNWNRRTVTLVKNFLSAYSSHSEENSFCQKLKRFMTPQSLTSKMTLKILNIQNWTDSKEGSLSTPRIVMLSACTHTTKVLSTNYLPSVVMQSSSSMMKNTSDFLPVSLLVFRTSTTLVKDTSKDLEWESWILKWLRESSMDSKDSVMLKKPPSSLTNTGRKEWPTHQLRWCWSTLCSRT